MAEFVMTGEEMTARAQVAHLFLRAAEAGRGNAVIEAEEARDALRVLFPDVFVEDAARLAQRLLHALDMHGVLISDTEMLDELIENLGLLRSKMGN